MINDEDVRKKERKILFKMISYQSMDFCCQWSNIHFDYHLDLITRLWLNSISKKRIKSNLDNQSTSIVLLKWSLHFNSIQFIDSSDTKNLYWLERWMTKICHPYWITKTMSKSLFVFGRDIQLKNRSNSSFLLLLHLISIKWRTNRFLPSNEMTFEELNSFFHLLNISLHFSSIQSNFSTDSFYSNSIKCLFKQTFISHINSIDTTLSAFVISDSLQSNWFQSLLFFSIDSFPMDQIKKD